jgi:hypothetical protein
MFAQALRQAIGGVEVPMVAHEQTLPIQPADAAAVIAPRDASGPTEFVSGEWRGLTGGQGGANRREAIGQGGGRMHLGEEGEFCFNRVNGGRRRRGRSARMERTAGHEE